MIHYLCVKEDAVIDCNKNSISLNSDRGRFHIFITTVAEMPFFCEEEITIYKLNVAIKYYVKRKCIITYVTYNKLKLHNPSIDILNFLQVHLN